MNICKETLEYNLELCMALRSELNTQTFVNHDKEDSTITLHLTFNDAIVLNKIVKHYQETKGEG